MSTAPGSLEAKRGITAARRPRSAFPGFRARREKGQTLAIAALVLPVMLGMGALAVDVGHLYVARTALQNAADAGAMAGAGALASS
ncbi:MAG: pilus assembly protein TadG-related protein, partial [Nitrospinota bacterium]